MAFMNATLNKKKEVFVLVPDDEFGPRHLDSTSLPSTLPAAEYSLDMTFGEAAELGLDGDDITDILSFLKEEKVDVFEVTKPLYWGYLSAPGYLDQTEKSLGETYAEVAQEMLDLWFDGEIEYMDEQERQELKWLERVAAGEDPEEALSADEEDENESE
jgi:hypothetical protein